MRHNSYTHGHIAGSNEAVPSGSRNDLTPENRLIQTVQGYFSDHGVVGPVEALTDSINFLMVSNSDDQGRFSDAFIADHVFECTRLVALLASLKDDIDCMRRRKEAGHE